jgi:hypothetical protein
VGDDGGGLEGTAKKPPHTVTRFFSRRPSHVMLESPTVRRLLPEATKRFLIDVSNSRIVGELEKCACSAAG